MKLDRSLMSKGFFGVAALAAIGAGVSCSSSSGAGDTPVGRQDQGNDAGAASNGGTSDPSDASSSVDASSPIEPPPPGKARVRVLAVDGTPRSGIKVVFHSSSGAPIETLTTDARGSVLRSVGQDEMATVLMRNLDAWPSTYSGTEAFTWVGVKVGDDLVTRESGARPPKTLNLSVTALSVPATMTSLSFSTAHTDEPGFVRQSCSASAGGALGTAVSLDVALSSDCVENGTTSLLSRVYNDMGEVHFALLKNAAVAAPVNVGPTWRAGVIASASTSNVPLEGGPSVSVEAWGIVGTTRAAIPHRLLFSLSTNFTGTPSTRPGTAPPDMFDAVERHAHSLTTGTTRDIVVRGPLQTPTYAFDFATALPLIKSLVATPDPAGRPSVTFTWPTGTVADAITVMIRAGTQRWRFIMPSDRRSITAPELPADLTEWALKGAIDQRTVAAYEIDVVGDYDAFRNQSLDWVAWTRDDQSLNPTLPKDATLRRVEAH